MLEHKQKEKGTWKEMSSLFKTGTEQSCEMSTEVNFVQRKLKLCAKYFNYRQRARNIIVKSLPISIIFFFRVSNLKYEIKS